MKEYCIRPIALAQGPRDGSDWTYMMNAGKPVGSGCYIWYIEGSSPKTLVDAGCRARAFVDRGLVEQDIQSVEEGLGKLGLKPEDIEIVIMTHLHYDHISLAAKYANARFIVQKAELEFALNPHPLIAGYRFYEERLPPSLRLETIEGDRDIIEGVNVILTPGHSPGGQSVAVSTAKGLAVITGFCASYDNFNLAPEARARGFEVLAPAKHTNALQAYDSALRVKKMADIILPLHEPAFAAIDRVPAE